MWMVRGRLLVSGMVKPDPGGPHGTRPASNPSSLAFKFFSRSKSLLSSGRPFPSVSVWVFGDESCVLVMSCSTGAKAASQRDLQIGQVHEGKATTGSEK